MVEKTKMTRGTSYQQCAIVFRWQCLRIQKVVRPALTGVASSDFGSRRRSIDAGRSAMLALLPQLRTAIEAKTK